VDVPGFLALFYVVAIYRKSLHGTYRPPSSLSLYPLHVKGKCRALSGRRGRSQPSFAGKCTIPIPLSNHSGV